MNHKEVKAKLLTDPATRKEYEKLGAMHDLTRQLIALRQEKNLSQAELAQLIGTRQSAISRLESGEYNPSIALLEKTAKVLGKRLEIRFR